MTASALYAAKELADRLMADLKASRIASVNVDHVRAICTGYLIGRAHAVTRPMIGEDEVDTFVEVTLRKFVEAA